MALTNEQVNELRERVLEMLEELGVKINDYRREMKSKQYDGSRCSNHVGDSNLHLEFLANCLHDLDRKKAGALIERLKRIESGIVDQCDACGEAIGFDRLMALPWTNYCITCRLEQERAAQIRGIILSYE